MTNAWVRFVLIASLLLGSVLVARAEVSVSERENSLDTLVLAIVDDFDPIGGAWTQYRQVPASHVLNLDGALRGDGPPSLGFWTVTEDSDPISGWPLVVWAYNTGTDHDVAFAEWDGSGWSVTEFLTNDTDDELDPKIYVEADGTAHVVWWAAGTSENVYLTTRAAGASTWNVPLLVTGGPEEGRRPAVAVFGGVLRIAYERDSGEPGMTQDVVVATQQPGGGFSLELVGSTTRAEGLDVMVHEKHGHLWLDWKHEPAEFGCAEHQGSSWILRAPEPWTDPSWVGVEETRKSIQNQIVGN